jgi:hypothetical protein
MKGPRVSLDLACESLDVGGRYNERSREAESDLNTEIKEHRRHRDQEQKADPSAAQVAL